MSANCSINEKIDDYFNFTMEMLITKTRNEGESWQIVIYNERRAIPIINSHYFMNRIRIVFLV